MRLTLINPNTSAATTADMVAIAQAEAGSRADIAGLTASFGSPLITDPKALTVAAQAVAALLPALADSDAVIIAAFGDPGLEDLRAALPCPVTGIAEAGMAEAGECRRRFAIVTTTPALVERIAARAAFFGHTNFAGTWVTPGDPPALMANLSSLTGALAEACRRAVAEGGAEAIVIGGGPLARAARALAGTLPVPLVEPVPAAVRLSIARYRSERLS